MGMFDITSFVAIILPPQSAMLAVGSVTERAVVRSGKVDVASMMNATLSPTTECPTARRAPGSSWRSRGSGDPLSLVV